MARKGPFKDLGWGKLGGAKKPSPKKTPGLNSTYRTSVMGQLKQQANAAAVEKKKVGGNYVGIVIRVEKKSPPTAAARSSWMSAWYDEILGVPLPETIKCKVRIPALHAGIPEPDKYGCETGPGIHQFWINMHPTFYASSQDIEEPACGDVVVVSVNADEGGGGGKSTGGGLIMSTVVTRENNPIARGGACPPGTMFPETAASTADGAEGDAVGGEEVSSLPISPNNLPADCDFECMMEALAGIASSPQLCSGRDPFGKVTECGSPFDKKGIFISQESFDRVGRGMPLPMPALLRALWADIGYVVIEVMEQTATKTTYADRDAVGTYATMFTLGGVNVYFSGTPYPGKAQSYVNYMSQIASDFPCKGMVMTPSWGYLSPGNKDKYSRQAKWLTDQMNKAAKAGMLQLGFSSPWMPSAEYTVAEADGEEGAVSIRYKDSFPYYCFSNVDWAIAQILSRSGRSVVEVDESAGTVELKSHRGEHALKDKDFIQVLTDYYKLGFKNIIPGFGVMGTGYEDYRVSSQKPPGRLRQEHDFLAAPEYQAYVGSLATYAEGEPANMAQPGFETSGEEGGGRMVKDWGQGYFGSTVPCGDDDDDPRCQEGRTLLDTWREMADLLGDAADTIETVEVPVMEWTDGWADYTIDEAGVITYMSPIAGAIVEVYSDNTSSELPGGCGTCYDAIMAIRPAAEMVDMAVSAIEDTTSKIWPPVPPDDPPVKAKVQWSITWWDWLNAEQHVPCWKSTRWDVIKNFHRYSARAYQRVEEGGNELMDSDGKSYSAKIQAAKEAIEAWNRVAASNPAMASISIEQYMQALNAMPSLLTFSNGSDMEEYAQAAAHVAQTAATEMGYDAEGSASGNATDTASDVADRYADADSYFGSDAVEVDENNSTGENGVVHEDGEAPPSDTGESGGGGVGLDAYPVFDYIDFNNPVNGGETGGWYPAHSTNFSTSTRDPGVIQQIVIHSTGGRQSPTAGGSTFAKEGRKASAHYGVNAAGYVFQFVKEKDIAWHCGVSNTSTGGPPTGATKVRRTAGAQGGQDKYQDQQNSKSIGIEISGLPEAEANSPGSIYNDNVYESLAFLVANICKRNQIAIDREHIIGHDEITLDRSDPGTWLQKEFPEGISYSFGGVTEDGKNLGPKGGDLPDGWKYQINSYSPNVSQTATFDWTRFLQLVTNFFEGAGVPMPPATSFDYGSTGATSDGGTPGDAATSTTTIPAAACNNATIPAGGSGGAPLTAAAFQSLGAMARSGRWPSGGSPALSSDFGSRNPPGGTGTSNHKGIDTISWENPAVPGSVRSSGNPGAIPIYSVGAGVIQIKRDPMSVTGGAGWWIGILHDPGVSGGSQSWSEYMHMENYAPNMEVGTRVTDGQIIGTMGTTPGCVDGVCYSTGVHLHFSMIPQYTRRSSTYMEDPVELLGLECNDYAKRQSRGYLCQAGNQNYMPRGPYPGY